jgi:hypothetical protein
MGSTSIGCPAMRFNAISEGGVRPFSNGGIVTPADAAERILRHLF